jgi:hypothetical protein
MSLFASGYRGADHATFTYLGRVNSGWGVCGITSAVYAMYVKRPAERATLINATRHGTVLAAIKNFLTELEAGGETRLLHEIELFNKTFRGPDFRLYEYVHRIIDGAEEDMMNFNGIIGVDEFRRKKKYGLALPPAGVARFLEKWGFEPKIRRMKGSFLPDLGGNAIVGVKNKGKDPTKPMYDGLVHWMYRHGGKIYSWGREFDSVEDADANFEVNWVIEVHNPKQPRIVEPETM